MVDLFYTITNSNKYISKAMPDREETLPVGQLITFSSLSACLSLEASKIIFLSEDLVDARSLNIDSPLPVR